MNKFKLLTTSKFDTQFKILDRSVQIIVKKWINNHLINVDDPKSYGKPLKANLVGYWRYRIGDYRMIVEIKDQELIIVAISIAHRTKFYK